MPREGMHQRTKFARGSRNVRSALNHLQFKDANGSLRKEDKANRCRSTMAISESWIQLAAFSTRCTLYLPEVFGKANA